MGGRAVGARGGLWGDRGWAVGVGGRDRGGLWVWGIGVGCGCGG